jgi:hypothetical protein
LRDYFEQEGTKGNGALFTFSVRSVSSCSIFLTPAETMVADLDGNRPLQYILRKARWLPTELRAGDLEQGAKPPFDLLRASKR